MGKFALDKKPSSYYLDQFREENIEIVVRTEQEASQCRCHKTLEIGSINITNGDDHFEVCFKANNSKIDPAHIEIARNVLSGIGEMDRYTRFFPNTDKYEPALAFVIINDDEVVLYYYGTKINTEWGAYFVKDKNGVWVFNELG